MKDFVKRFSLTFLTVIGALPSAAQSGESLLESLELTNRLLGQVRMESPSCIPVSTRARGCSDPAERARNPLKIESIRFNAEVQPMHGANSTGAWQSLYGAGRQLQCAFYSDSGSIRSQSLPAGTQLRVDRTSKGGAQVISVRGVHSLLTLRIQDSPIREVRCLFSGVAELNPVILAEAGMSGGLFEIVFQSCD